MMAWGLYQSKIEFCTCSLPVQCGMPYVGWYRVVWQTMIQSKVCAWDFIPVWFGIVRTPYQDILPTIFLNLYVNVLAQNGTGQYISRYTSIWGSTSWYGMVWGPYQPKLEFCIGSLLLQYGMPPYQMMQSGIIDYDSKSLMKFTSL